MKMIKIIWGDIVKIYKKDEDKFILGVHVFAIIYSFITLFFTDFFMYILLFILAIEVIIFGLFYTYEIIKIIKDYLKSVRKRAKNNGS